MEARIRHRPTQKEKGKPGGSTLNKSRVHPRVWNNIKEAQRKERWKSETPRKEEIDKAMRQMGLGKAGGDDEVLADHIKYRGEALQEEVVKIVRTMWERAAYAEEGKEAEGWPQEWTIAIQVPLWKGRGN